MQITGEDKKYRVKQMRKDKNACPLHNKLLNKNKYGINGGYFIMFTAVFAVLILIILREFIIDDRTLVRNGDAFIQHYKALMYLAKYIREFIRNILFEHRFVIPQWDFEVGMGSDIISTFAYYSFGDPFNYLSFLVPTRYIHLYYETMIVLRLYCAGLSFSYLCFKTGEKNKFAVLAGALTYCFSAWAVYSGLKHPYFINPMVFLPLIVLGVEKVIKGKGIFLLSFMVALATISNFYFFYIIVLLTVIYVAVRIISLYKTDIKAMVKPFFTIAGASALGVCMGAVLFLPVVLAFLGDSRSSAEHTIGLFYSLASYMRLPVSFLTSGTPSSWLYPGVSVLFIPSLAILFAQKKKNTHIKTLIIICLVMMCFPVFGKIFNGFSYACNRWCFGYVLVAAYIVTISWNKLLGAHKRDVMAATVGMVIITVLSLVLSSKLRSEAIVPFVLFGIIVAIISLLCAGKIKINPVVLQIIFIGFAVVSIITYSHYMISPAGRNYVSEFSEEEFYTHGTYKSDRKVLKASKGDTDNFWRYTGREISKNSSFLSSLRSTQYYYSLSNGNISTFRVEMNMNENSPYSYRGFDSRTVLSNLASVKYFVNIDKSNKSAPYGYEKTKTKGVWKNKYTLPFGYTYDSYITKDQFDSLDNSVDREQIMLSHVVLEDETDLIKTGDINPTSIDVDYKVNCVGKHVTGDKNKFVVTKKGAKVEFIFPAVENAETILSLVNLDFKGTNPYDLYSDNTDVDPYNLFSFDGISEEESRNINKKKNLWKQENRVNFEVIGRGEDGKKYKNTFFYYSPTASFYTGRRNFDINIGYVEKGIKKITLVFTQPGTYTFDDIRVIAQTMDGYEEKVSELKQDTLQNLVFDYNNIKGDISLNTGKVLCLSMPYANGWTAYVDGEETELVKVNGMYTGLLLEAGDHEIELRYSTPGLKLGIAISFVSIAFYIFLYVYSRKQKGEKPSKVL